MMLLHVFARRHAVDTLKEGGEGCRIRETTGIDNFCDIHILGRQQVGGLF